MATRAWVWLFLFFAFLPSAYAGGAREKPVTLVYSSSLNGNLDGCACRSNPRAGLVKRAAWLRAQKRQAGWEARTVLLDCGDLLDVRPDSLLARDLFDVYGELGYDAICVGDQELSNGIGPLLSALETGAPLLSNNMTICPDETRCIFFSAAPLLLKRAGTSIAVVALTDPVVFALYPRELTSKLKVYDPLSAARRAIEQLKDSRPALVVLLYHGPLEAAEAIARSVEGIHVILVGHEQRLLPAYKVGKTIIASPGEEGNQLGILTLAVDVNGGVGFRNAFHRFNYESDPDEPGVRERIDRYHAALKKRIVTE